MTYGAAITPKGGRRLATPAPELLIQRSPAGEPPDLVDRILDLQEAIARQHLARATGQRIPLLEELELEREKVSVLMAVRDRGNDVDVVLSALAAATYRVSDLEAQLAREIEHAEAGH